VNAAQAVSKTNSMQNAWYCTIRPNATSRPQDATSAAAMGATRPLVGTAP
jgi:hypothetical protein